MDPVDRAERRRSECLSCGHDFGRNGIAWCETDVEATDLETVITDLFDGQYKNPVRVVGFNVAKRWVRDVSEDVADEIQQRCDLKLIDVPDQLLDFVDRHATVIGGS